MHQNMPKQPLSHAFQLQGLPESMTQPLSAGRLNKKNGWTVRIHVDAASGGFVAPFIFPELKWDFRLHNVCPRPMWL